MAEGQFKDRVLFNIRVLQAADMFFLQGSYPITSRLVQELQASSNFRLRWASRSTLAPCAAERI